MKKITTAIRKKIVFFLLKKYTRDERGRMEIFNLLNKQVENTYPEQSTFGNVYNSNIEFIMSNDFIAHLAKENDFNSINTIQSGLNTAFQKAVTYLKNEKTH